MLYYLAWSPMPRRPWSWRRSDGSTYRLKDGRTATFDTVEQGIAFAKRRGWTDKGIFYRDPGPKRDTKTDEQFVVLAEVDDGTTHTYCVPTSRKEAESIAEKLRPIRRNVRCMDVSLLRI